MKALGKPCIRTYVDVDININIDIDIDQENQNKVYATQRHVSK